MNRRDADDVSNIGDDGDVMVDVVVSRAVPPTTLESAVPSIFSVSPTPRRPGERITVLTLNWRKSDPMAVYLTVRSTPDHPALPRGRWVVLRDYLRYGLEEPTGDGAVRVG